MGSAAQRSLLPEDRKRTRESEMLETAASGPRDLMEKGSPDWCWSALLHLRTVWLNEQSTIARWEKTLAEVRTARAWEKVPKGDPYGTEDAMMRDLLGVGVDEAQRTMEARQAMLDAQPQDGRAHGGKREGAGRPPEDRPRGNQDSNCNLDSKPSSDSPKQKRDASYWLGRLKREAPEYAAAWVRGEYNGVHGACVAAGLKPPADPVKRAASLIRKMSDQQREALWIELRDVLGEV